jgi:Ca2+-binding EF-hand superfamily protein
MKICEKKKLALSLFQNFQDKKSSMISFSEFVCCTSIFLRASKEKKLEGKKR